MIDISIHTHIYIYIDIYIYVYTLVELGREMDMMINQINHWNWGYSLRQTQFPCRLFAGCCLPSARRM
jgi:hypothetical protein